MKTAAQVELAAICEKQMSGSMSLEATRSWISKHLLSVSTTSSVAVGRSDSSMRRALVLEAVAEGIVDLVFSPPLFSSSTLASLSRQIFLPPSPPTPRSRSEGRGWSFYHHQQPQQAPDTSVPGYPETLWLDQTRLSILSTDAADLLALYMLMLLFRQAVHSLGASNDPSSSSPYIHPWELERVKKEIWELGPERPGWRFFKGGIGVLHKPSEEDEIKWQQSMRRVTLQIGRRALENVSRSNRRKGSSSPLENGEDMEKDMEVGEREDGCSMTTTMTVAQHEHSSLLSLLEGWVDTNLGQGSELYVLMRKRLRSVMLQFVRTSVLGATSSSSSSPSPSFLSSSPSLPSSSTSSSVNVPPGLGLESLIPEIRHLGERISDLVIFHTRVFGEIYEDSEF